MPLTPILFGAVGPLEDPPEMAYPRLVAPWMLPPWVSRGRGFVTTLLRALGDELDRVRRQHRAIAEQATIPEVTFTFAEWEQQLGLPVDATIPDSARRARLLARRRGLNGLAIGAYLRELVRTLTSQTASPSVFVEPGRWTVFKLAGRGWPGDAVFGEAERRLRRSGPAAFGNSIAAWDDVLGLTFGQMDPMTFEALDTLSWTEINGGS